MSSPTRRSHRARAAARSGAARNRVALVVAALGLVGGSAVVIPNLGATAASRNEIGTQGLLAEYFASQDLSGTPVLRRTEAVDLTPGDSEAAPGVPADHFSVRWTGTLDVERSGRHVFTTRSDDGVRLWVNDTLVIDNWTLHSSTTNRASVRLTAGRPAQLRVEFFENEGTAVAQLLLRQPGQARAQLVPVARLHPAGQTPPAVTPTPTPSPSESASPSPSKSPSESPSPSGSPSPSASPDPAPAAGEAGARHRERVTLPAKLGTSVADYGAVPDDGKDDTAALRKALADGRKEGEDDFGRTKRLVFPPGQYDISDTLQVIGCCVTFQGSGTGATVLRVKDGTDGFGDAAKPRAVIRTIDGNMAFRNNVRDLTIDVGSGNPGAVGLDYVGNNQASIENVVVRAGKGSGATGVSMLRYGPGPDLVSDLTVEGFDVGVAVANPEYAPTFSRVTLRGQRVAGIRNDGNSLPIERLLSVNDVPAVVNRGASGSVAIIDSRLEGTAGASGTSAIVSEASLLARSVTTTGYASAIEEAGTAVPGADVAEYIGGTKAHSPFAATAHTLDLPVKQAPRPPEVPAADWALFTPRGYNEDGDKIQALFDSGATVVAFPYETYLVSRVVDVPCSVQRVTGFGAGINDDAGVNLTLKVSKDCATPLVIEDFGYGAHVLHESKRTVVVRHGNIEYKASPGAGDAFLEDLSTSPLTVQRGQHVWARQLNIEFQPLQIDNDGGDLWVLGYKTEGQGTLSSTRGGGNTEILGGLVYAIPKADWDRSNAAFEAVDSRQSIWISGSNYSAPGFYSTYVEETRDGTTVRVPSSDTPRWRLFSGAADR